MVDRKPLSQKTRFEVFKRDRFACQYCGATAPDVVLHVDHIKPVSKGGTNDILNLVTACKDCNGGKGARELSDDTAIIKQRAQLEELEARREQLELLMEWQASLENFEEDEVSAITEKFSELTDYTINDTGRAKVKRWIRKHGIAKVLSATITSVEQYAEGVDGAERDDAVNKAFDYIPRILSVRERHAGDPHMPDLFYIRGILRNRLSYLNERQVMGILTDAVEDGVAVDELKEIAKQVRSWSQFTEEVDWLVNGGDSE